jgi:predicted O-linked N-acetylglucosamine transferase (SPINDLY family)
LLGERLNFKYGYHHSRIRIGYLSADFRLHPLASLITELIEVHDRKHFEIYAYSYGINDETPERKRFTLAFDHFVDIRANKKCIFLYKHVAGLWGHYT